MPRVTVIASAVGHNGVAPESLESVFAQTFGDYELVVLDDGDDAAARRDAICRVRSPFVAFLPSGSIWTPRKLERQVAYFERFPSALLVHAATRRSGASAPPLESISVAVESAVADPPRAISDALRRGDVDIATATVMVRRDALADVDARGEWLAATDSAGDSELWRRIAERGPVGFISTALAICPAPLGSKRRAKRDSIAAAPHNLVHDTAMWRARSALVRSVHALDDWVWRAVRARARILFEAASPLSLAVFRPVLDRLAGDPRIEIWFTTSDGSWDATQIFTAAGIRERVIPTGRARLMKFDAYVNSDFWSMTWLPRRTRRVHLFHGVAGKYGLDAPAGIAPVVASYDRLLFPNRDRLLRYAEAGLIDPESPCAALIGYPKVDCLVDGSLDRAAIHRDLGLDPTLPTVLYAPTWSPFSSLSSMGDEVIAALSRLAANVIVKLHDRSYELTERGSGGVDWNRRLEHLSRGGRVHLARGPDASPYLFASDVLVTDHSSVGFEFMLLDRPIVVIDCPALVEHARINPDKVALLHSAAHVVTEARDVAGAVLRGLSRPSAFGDRRRAIAGDMFYCPGGAAARAARVIYELLAIPEPEAAAVAIGDGRLRPGRSGQLDVRGSPLMSRTVGPKRAQSTHAFAFDTGRAAGDAAIVPKPGT